MNNLTKVCSIWNNLDESYERMAKKLKVNTRTEFIKKIVGFDEKEKTTKVEYIKGKLNEELGNYSSVEMDVYNNIIAVLTGVDLLLRGDNVESIEYLRSLNDIVTESLVEVKNVKEVSNKMKDTFFNELTPIKSPLTQLDEYMTLNEVYDLTGCIGETFILNKDNTVSSYVLTNIENEVFTYNSLSDIIGLLKQLETPATKTFASYCMKCYQILEETGRLKPHTVMLSKKYYSVEGKELIISFGGSKLKVKITPQKIISTDKVYGYTIKAQTKYAPVQLVLLAV